MAGHLNDRLLAKLDGPTFAALENHLSPVQLGMGQVLADSHDHVQKVYFPQSGIISCVVELIDGSAIETGMIGKDGQFGAGPPVFPPGEKTRSAMSRAAWLFRC